MSNIRCPNCRSYADGLFAKKGNSCCKRCKGTEKSYQDIGEGIAELATFGLTKAEGTCKLCFGTGQCKTCGGIGLVKDESDFVDIWKKAQSKVFYIYHTINHLRDHFSAQNRALPNFPDPDIRLPVTPPVIFKRP